MRSRAAAPHKPAIQWLGQGQGSAALLATAQRLLQAQQRVRQILAGPMGQACQVTQLQGVVMALAVPSAAHAAKLRQLTPEICRQMGKHGWDIQQVQIRITLQPSAPLKVPAVRHGTPLDPAGLQAFAQLADTLPAGELANAVQRLLKHHRG